LIKESGKKGVWVGAEEKGLYDKAKQCTLSFCFYLDEERKEIEEDDRGR
jgi:hypothetical protein